ncbi:serine/threonine-protein phosphatase 4 regulatory subunit 1-like [Castor canadensis]|uniref:Serine/threonine-protein phosphatase 4 regulatory subunit 1-like n=1 Tax=Castor canadensis TaxID=51338 RepID=A0AC58KV32_CASCN
MNCISHRHSRSCHNIFWEAPPPARTGLHVRTSPTGVDADKLGVDDYNSESGVLITHSALDFVSEDETLTPLGRLEKYAASEDVLNRQIVAQNLLNTLREVSDNKRHCITVWEIITQLADDPESIVRAELMEQVPQIALFCQDNQTFITNAFSKYLLPILIRYLSDQNNVVWGKSQETLMALLEEELIERFDLETKVCPVLMELTAPDSDEFVKAEVLPIMCKMIPMVGEYITKCFILPRFCEMCCDYGMFHIRKVCAGNFGDICSVVGQQATEEMLLPRFFQLCLDNEWGVRKACAECFTAVSYATSQEIRWDKLSAIFVDLISDPSHRVCQAAFQSLGPFISTFLNRSRSGQYFEEESNPSEDVSEDKYSIGDQDIPKFGQIRPEAVPLNLSITNSSFKLGNALEDGAAEICQNCTSEINIPVDSSLLCTLSSESNQEASSNEKDGNLNNYQSALQPKVSTSSQDYTLLGKKLPNSLNFWKTLSFEIDLAEEFEQDSGKSLSPERSEEAPEVTTPGSLNINMTTRNELEKLTENLEPHIDGTDVKAQVEELSAVLHASSLDAYEETFRMEERHELQEDVGIHELPNSNVNLDDSVPLISDADENKDTTAHYVHSDADVNTISDLNPEEERRPKVQDDVPQALLDQYLSMTDPSLAEMIDTEIVKHCAYSLPGVALTLGRRNWHCLRETYKILASNTQYKVRRTLAFSIHMLAIILGDELTDADLVPIFNGFLKDVDEVRIGVLKHLYDFLCLLHIDKRREYLYELQEFLVTDNRINWHFRAELAKQLIFLLQLYSPRDVYEYLCPIALHLCADKVSSVRLVSYKLVSKMVMKLHRETPVTFGVDFLNELVENFGRCPKWSGWQAFVFICQTIIEDDCLPMDQFAVYLMPHLLTLVNDKIPNVRVLLAKTLRQILHEKECFLASGSCHQEAVEQAIMTLQMDRDSDVKYFASKHPTSSKISKDVMNTASSTY